jgi:hypothetical protein
MVIAVAVAVPLGVVLLSAVGLLVYLRYRKPAGGARGKALADEEQGRGNSRTRGSDGKAGDGLLFGGLDDDERPQWVSASEGVAVSGTRALA